MSKIAINSFFICLGLFFNFYVFSQENYKEIINKVWNNSDFQKSSEKNIDIVNRYNKPRRKIKFTPYFNFNSGQFWKFIIYTTSVILTIILLKHILTWFMNVKKNENLSKKAQLNKHNRTQQIKNIDKLFQEDDYLEAVRRFFKQAIELLNTKEYLPDKPYLTNNEFTNLLNNCMLHDLLQQLSYFIEKGYYAGKKITKEDFNKCQQLWKQMKEYLLRNQI